MRAKFLAFVFVGLLAASPVRAAESCYLTDGKPDPVILLAAPPLANSQEQAADLAEVERVYHSAPEKEKALAYTQRRFTAFIFSPALGSSFQSGKFPVTETFLSHVQTDAEAAVKLAKMHWKRPRPYTVDPALANGKLEKSFSYPSGHSTESMVLALVLTELFPQKTDALLAEARQIGWHRVVIACHYPTDIYAGRVYAQAIVRQMKKSPRFQTDLAAAQQELARASQP